MRVRVRARRACSRCSTLQLQRASPAAAAASCGLHCAWREVLGGEGCAVGCGDCDGTCT